MSSAFCFMYVYILYSYQDPKNKNFILAFMTATMEKFSRVLNKAMLFYLIHKDSEEK